MKVGDQSTSPLRSVVRHENRSDIDAIYRLTQRAFAGKPYSGGDEQDLINALRDVGALTLSLVAEDCGQHYMIRSLNGETPQTVVAFHPTFQMTGTP